VAAKGNTGDKGYTAKVPFGGGKSGKSPDKKMKSGGGYSGVESNYGLKSGIKSAASTFKKPNKFPANLSGGGGAGKGKNGAKNADKFY
jgi:hypothetical protein